MRFPDATRGRAIRREESIRFALRALAGDKLKASLTMLGVAIGSAAIVLVVTIASTGKVYMISQIEGIGANLAYATLDRNGVSSVRDDELTPDDIVAVRHALPAAIAVAGTYDIPVDLQLRGKVLHPRLVGVTQDFEKIRNLRINSGRYFDREDFLARFKVCLITDQVAQTALGLVRSIGCLIKNVVPLGISWIAVAVALVVSSGVGVLFGYRPASEAANLSPIDALRIE